MRSLWPTAVGFFVVLACTAFLDVTLIVVDTQALADDDSLLEWIRAISGAEPYELLDNLQFASLVLCAVPFLIWLGFARANAERLSPVRHRMTRGWVVWAWLVPILNLWWPKQIVDDIWRTSERPAEQIDLSKGPRPPLVLAWWIAWVVVPVGGFVFILLPVGDLVAGLFGALAELVAAVLVTRVVLRITRLQEVDQ